MQGGRRKMMGVTVMAALFLLLALSCSQAYAERILKASCPSVCGETVLSRDARGSMVLSIPGAWDTEAVVLETDGIVELYLGDATEAFRPGQAGSITGLIGTPCKLRDGAGKQLGTVTILQGSRVPALFLTADADLVRRIRGNKDFQITDGSAAWLDAEGKTGYNGAVTQFKCRGNNTFSYLKKPYQIKLAEKADLGGMGAAKTWVLLADWCDISLLRNRIVLDLSREIGLKNALGCCPADVWINGDYQGLYLVTEKIQIGQERIPVTNLEKAAEKAAEQPADPGKMKRASTEELSMIRFYPDRKDPEDITGGYIATIEKIHRLRDYALAGFMTSEGLNVQIKEPTEPSRAQTEYLGKAIYRVQRALIAEDGTDPESGQAYSELIDTESFALRCLTEEWSKNYDMLGGSQFIYKDSDLVDPRIYAGPAWDYDLSFGNMQDRGLSPVGSYISQYRKNSNLYWLLEKQEDFRQLEEQLWRERFRPAAAVLLGETEGAEGSCLHSLDEYRAEIEASAEMNFARWGINTAASAPYAGESFDHAFRYLKDWIRQRTEWMDTHFGTGE